MSDTSSTPTPLTAPQPVASGTPVGALAGGAPGNPAAAVAAAQAAGQRSSVIQLNIKEKAALYAAYIPVFKQGGIFVPSTRPHRLGDSLYLLLTLPDDSQRYPVAGKVAWITPAGATGKRTQGVGLQFPDDDICRQLKLRIEQILGDRLMSDRPNQTI